MTARPPSHRRLAAARRRDAVSKHVWLALQRAFLAWRLSSAGGRGGGRRRPALAARPWANEAEAAREAWRAAGRRLEARKTAAVGRDDGSAIHAGQFSVPIVRFHTTENGARKNDGATLV
jgi:hypothetical protein